MLITKANKGDSVVILDGAKYIEKIELIIGDKVTFKLIDNDSTLTREDCLTRKLRGLKACRFSCPSEGTHPESTEKVLTPENAARTHEY